MEQEQQQEYILLSSSGCMPCVMMKHFMEGMNIPFRYVNIRGKEDEELVKRLREGSKAMSIPQLFDSNEEFLAGGSGSILQYFKQGMNDEELEQAATVWRDAREKASKDMTGKRIERMRRRTR